jgi:hypothetical protein
MKYCVCVCVCVWGGERERCTDILYDTPVLRKPTEIDLNIM